MKRLKPKPTRGGTRAGSGRKKFKRELKIYSLKLHIDAMTRIKGNKSKFMREAIDEKHERDSA